ncbi:MAG TPA: FAD-dependent oxidoreductase [Candidatus Saccharimonadales bacterium]|nr:FAD-dependent oxidoreductase [Candidatus Saccharimonadales bacterium]
MIYDIKLLKKETVAKDTMTFYWEKPTDFEYTAGQNGDFTLIDPPETDDEGNKRTFSFVSTPSNENLITTTRMRGSAFKRSLKNLPVGTIVKLDGPYGDFILHKNQAKPAVFLIGGIGITPVRSIIADATHNHLPYKITLIYSNRTPDGAPFIAELENFAKNNPNFKFVPVYTKVSEKQWSGEKGHIDLQMLKKYIPEPALPIYYLSGPATMVKAMRRLLIEVGADEDNIRVEEFSGY